MAFDDRMRAVERLSVVLGLNGGYPNFQEADLGDEVVYGTYFFHPGPHIEWRNVSRSDLGGVMMQDRDAFFRAIDNFSNTVPGAVCGIPTCEQGIENGEVVYGVYFLKNHPLLEWRNIPRSDLFNVPLSGVESMFRAVDEYCIAHPELFSGFPSFQQGTSNGVVVYGVYFLKQGYPAEWRNVPLDVFNMLSKYSFSTDITDAQRLRLLERHAFGYGTTRTCGNLTTAERTALKQAYRKNITHGVNNKPRENANSIVGGATINVNFNVLFPLGDNEIAQTLIHEMMHCAGFQHPARRDPPSPVVDTPGDNGPYYSSPPLRAELCIAGAQSDSSCIGLGDTCIYLTPEASRTAVPVIESVQFNPAGPDIVSEHVVITNSGGISVNMTAWTLTDTAKHVYTFPNFSLDPQEKVRLWTGKGADDARNLFWGRNQAVWNNTGDSAILRNTTGQEVSIYTYP